MPQYDFMGIIIFHLFCKTYSILNVRILVFKFLCYNRVYHIFHKNNGTQVKKIVKFCNLIVNLKLFVLHTILSIFSIGKICINFFNLVGCTDCTNMFEQDPHYCLYYETFYYICEINGGKKFHATYLDIWIYHLYYQKFYFCEI